MSWRRAEESNPHPGPSRSAGFRDQKALPSLRALRWSESRDSNPVRAVLRTAASNHFGISHMAHPRGIEPRIAVLEAATVTVRSGAWYQFCRSLTRACTYKLSKVLAESWKFHP